MKKQQFLNDFFLRLFFLTCFLAWVVTSLNAQSIRGSVHDAVSAQAIAGASVVLINTAEGALPQHAVGDTNGFFMLENLQPGYYRCLVQAPGYEPFLIKEVVLGAGKITQLDIALTPVATQLPGLNITALAPGRNPLQEIGEIQLSREQTLRFPAMAFDPARLAAAFPGVAQTDDGINGMSIRGNSPAAVRWRLEGLEIVNPNHLPNAGTFSDGPAAASGGVLMFSAQLMDNSRLLTGAFAPGYGDASAGIMDMYLRPGNPWESEYTIQAGLIGLDLAAEGPINKHKGSSYIANYRYSTVGLLGKLGVSFGDEQINFQDLAFNLRFPSAKAGTLTFFGMGGRSENSYRHNSDSASIESYKAFFDINFQSFTALSGLTHSISLGKNTWLKTALIGSTQQNERSALPAFASVGDDADSQSSEVEIAAGTTLSHKIGASNTLTCGLQYTQRHYDGDARWTHEVYYRGTGDLALWQPWAAWEWHSGNNKTSLKAGMHALLAPFNQSTAVDPRLSFRQQLSARQQLIFHWGLNSSSLPVWLYVGEDPILQTARNQNLDFMKTQQVSARYTFQWSESLSLFAEAYWQETRNVPVDAEEANAYALGNEVEAVFSNHTLANGGKARNYGLEAAAAYSLTNGFYWNVNASLFQSKYTGSDEVWRDSRWALGHLSNLLVGKEWTRQKKANLYKSFGLSGRLVWSGGFRIQATDAARNPFAYRPFAVAPALYDEQLPDYFRLDLRVYWKKNLGNRRNATFAMEFQNATLQQNLAYYYWDPFLKAQQSKYQLGLIPFISWRLEL